jgi:phenylacetate-CoA ligase
MSVRNVIAEKITLPFSDMILGQSVFKNLRLLNESQFWTRSQIDEFQNDRLRKLIEHCVSSVPYYKDLFRELKLKSEDINTKDDLYKIPILSKEMIKKEGIERFLSTNYPKNKIISASSSGSTGEPLFYKTTKEAYSMNIAANLRGWSWMNYRIGDKYVKLSENPRNNIIKKFQDKFSSNLYLATNPLIESNFKSILDQIERYKPKVIRCYPDPLLYLARYRKMSNNYSFQPKAITTTGNTLYPEIRAEIEDAFGCKIFDSYSCEGNSNVFECETNTGYHSTEEYGISEILDNTGNIVNHGIGRLISTDLWNNVHPFIRYETQDQVEATRENCICGRNLIRYKRILGRSNDVITASNGQLFIVHNFTGFFQTDHEQLKKSIEHFQIVKTIKNEIMINIVVNDSYDENVGSFIQNYWFKRLNYTIKINIVDEISLTKSGKRKFIINEKV